MASPFERNQQYVQKGDHEYNTQLSKADEKRFLEWVQKNDVQFDPRERAPDYDMRGYWQAFTDPKHPDNDKARPPQQNPNDNKPHFTDYWKTPYHQSFSRDSQWANKNAPKWNDKDQLVDRSGKVVFDERRQSRAPIEGTDMARRSSRPQEKTGIDRAVDRFLRFGNDQIPGAKPQRNVAELLANLGRGRAGLREGLVPGSYPQGPNIFRNEPQQRGATLREGMSGPQVKALQDDLVRAGLLKPGSYDVGKFAGATAAAVRQLEQMHGLRRDAGVAGPQVFGQLRPGSMPPPVPQSRPSTAAPTTRTTAPPRSTEPVPTRSPPPVTQQNLPPPVTAAPPPIPQPNPTPQVAAPPPVQAQPAPTPQITAPPTPQVSPEWQAYIESQRTGPTYVPPSPPPPQRDFTLESEAKLNAPNPVQGNPQGLTLDQIGRPPDMALRMGEDRGMQGWPPQAPPSPNAALQDRQAAAQQQAAQVMADAQRAQQAAQTAPQVAPPPSAATASPAGRVPFVDQSVLAPNYNALPVGGKEQGRLGTALDRPSGFNFTKELPPSYVPPLPPRADIAFNAPSLSPAAPKGGPGGVMSPAALASLPGSGMLASQEARPSLRQAGAMPAASTPIPQVQAPPAPQITARGIGGAGREPPPEQLKAELEAAMQQRIDDMKAGLAGPFSNPPLPDVGAAAPGLGQTTIGTANDPFPNFPTPGLTPAGDRANEPRPSQYEAPTGAFLGDLGGGIPTIQAPPLESIVQPQVDQGQGQGLLGVNELGSLGQAPPEGSINHDQQSLLDAISSMDFSNTTQDQPGGDNTGGTASAASGDQSGLTGGQLTDQGILAMLEEMFGSGSTGR